MKNLKLIGFLTIMVSSLLFIGCTTDYAEIAGPAGPAGADGVAGADGANGADGADASAASCISCHSNSHRDPIYAAYDLSFHSKGLTEGAVNYAGARASCAQCHSHEGYYDYITYGATNPTGYYGLSDPEPIINDNGTPDDPSDDFPELGEFGEILYTNNPVAVVTPISCDTCHGTHQSFDFENDGQDYALRGLEPVSLITDGTVIDYGGGSNACIDCHQPRRTGPVDDGEGNFRVTSTHWGPHHGPQATMLEGIQGAEMAGSVAYPASGSSTHRIDASCVSCHMGETDNGSNGLHSMLPSDNSCVACHSTVPTEVTGLQADMDHLGELLEVAGILHFEDNEWHPVKGTFTIEVAEAAWNFLFVYEDMSRGIHNPGYAKALISNSIEAIE